MRELAGVVTSEAITFPESVRRYPELQVPEIMKELSFEVIGLTLGVVMTGGCKELISRIHWKD